MNDEQIASTDTPNLYQQVREHWDDMEMPWPLERLREFLCLSDEMPRNHWSGGRWQLANMRIADLRVMFNQFEPMPEGNTKAVLDELIGIFELDGDPGEIIRSHYVTNEAERLRWLAAFTEMRTRLGKAARDHIELRDKRTDLLNIRGALSPADQPHLRVVPMDLGSEVAPAVQWLVDEVLRLRELVGEPESVARQVEA
jgi:hypothetical protein